MVIGTNPTPIRIYKFLVIANSLHIHIIIIIIKNFQSEQHLNIHVLYIAPAARFCVKINNTIINRVDKTQVWLIQCKNSSCFT